MKAIQEQQIDAGEHLSELKNIYQTLNHAEVCSVEDLLKKEELLKDIETAVPQGMVVAWRCEAEGEDAAKLDERIARRAALLSDYRANGGIGCF